MKIRLDKDASKPLYQQIVDQVRQQILSGELLPGYRLPPERRLSESLGINRTTVLNAYRELKAENLIDSHVGQGTVVLPHSSVNDEMDHTIPQEPIWNHYFSAYSNRFDPHIINDLLNLANRSDMISFATGIASPECGPLEIFHGIEQEILAEKNSQSLLHSPVEGFTSLRNVLRTYMEKRGCYLNTDEVMILAGSQQGIDLVARVLLDPGDIVVVEEPTFFPALQVFRSTGARVMGVPVDDEGMQVDVLEQLLQRYHPKFLYTIPTFHNPCGVEMTLERRRRLIELVHKYKLLVLEDDAYGELCYDHPPLPTLKSMDTGGFVLYMSTFSKIIYPGLRIGWLVAHKKMIQRLAAVRQTVDLHTNCLSQRLVERFISGGRQDLHLKKICKEYAQRRDIMLDALTRCAPPGVSWEMPHGGYYVWCRLPDGVSAARLLAKAAEYKVVFVPGNSFFLSDQGDHFIRLNFTFASKPDITRGIQLLCDAIRALQKEAPAVSSEPFMDLSPIV